MLNKSKLGVKPDLLTIMIATRFFELIVSNNRFKFIIGSIDHNRMIVTYYDDQNFQLYHGFGVD